MIEFLIENSGGLMVVFTAVVTISTVVYAFLTARLASETRKMRLAQTDPKIEVVVKPREEWINFMNLYVRNIGMGPAYDLNFQFHAEASPEGAEMLIKDFTESAFLKSGLRYLGPGEKAESNVTAIHEGYDKKIEAVLGVQVRYRNSSGREIKETFRLDFSEFRGLSRLGEPHLYAIAQSLSKIQKDVDHIASGFRRLRVDVFTEEDRIREREQRETARQ